ncbi:hypothetical protein AACH06_30060 [Ideonella sp. DXS29W]|uniref:Uncharacterized protein n=1 Tax=Ideonella lacteola TaxID=2984193 RepID=A0ABU9C323_9BURK
MEKPLDRMRAGVESRIREALVGASLERVTYAITYWELVFLAQHDVTLMAAEILLPDQESPEEESEQAVKVGSLLLRLTNKSRVVAVDVQANGDMIVSFLGGESVRLLAHVPNVDWTWSLRSEEFRFVCDGALE